MRLLVNPESFCQCKVPLPCLHFARFATIPSLLEDAPCLRDAPASSARTDSDAISCSATQAPDPCQWGSSASADFQPAQFQLPVRLLQLHAPCLPEPTPYRAVAPHPCRWAQASSHGLACPFATALASVAALRGVPNRPTAQPLRTLQELRFWTLLSCSLGSFSSFNGRTHQDGQIRFGWKGGLRRVGGGEY